jgi:hypothetical protein
MRTHRFVRAPLWATLLAALIAAVVVSLVGFVQSGEAAQRNDAPPDERPKIANGDPANHPFMVALMDNTLGDPANPEVPWLFPLAFICGATLIDQDSVLTAAHCLEWREESLSGTRICEKDWEAVNTTPGLWEFSAVLGQPPLTQVTNYGEKANAFGVTHVWLHPEYKCRPGPDSPQIAGPYDVAVLKIDRTTGRSLGRSAAPADASPIALAPKGQAGNKLEKPGRTAQVAGWGVTTPGGAEVAELKGASVKIISDTAAFTRHSPDYNKALHVASEKRTCAGDSGGPLFVGSGNRVTQIGITSWGTNTCEPGTGEQYPPDVYTEVNAPIIYSFIKEHMAK